MSQLGTLTEKQRKSHDALQTNFPYFAKNALRIRTKAGDMLPLVLNVAQEYLHQRLEFQLQATGKIRALILKGRQQGCSTYVGGRFYWKTTRLSGKATFILSHEADTTEKLFQMVERYHANCPDPVKATTDVANRRRMVFSGINSEYFVGTAGNENVGRGGTIQYLHASEAAFYPDGDGFSKGLLQSVPDLSGTEVIIESTANGMDPLFYAMCMDALAGRSEYQLIFIPWFWQPEYRKTPPVNFQLESSELVGDERTVKELYNLDDAQIYWRRMKIGELKSLKGFMQEYPCNVEEAFVSSGNSLISSIKIMEARASNQKDPDAPLVMGVDPAPRGRSGIAFRRGREMMRGFEVMGAEPMQLVGIVANFIDTHKPVKCFIDLGNGYGVYDRLVELGYGDIVTGVHFGEGALQERVYLNKRVEMWSTMAEWFAGGGVSCPDDDVLHKELTCVPASKKTSSGLQKLEAKDKIREDTGISPDIADAFALTFAYPVKRVDPDMQRTIRRKDGHGSPLTTNQRRDKFTGRNQPKNNSVVFFGR